MLQIAPGDPLPPEVSSGLGIRSDTFRVSLSFRKGNDVRKATAIVLRTPTAVTRLRWDPDGTSP